MIRPIDEIVICTPKKQEAVEIFHRLIAHGAKNPYGYTDEYILDFFSEHSNLIVFRGEVELVCAGEYRGQKCIYPYEAEYLLPLVSEIPNDIRLMAMDVRAWPWHKESGERFIEDFLIPARRAIEYNQEEQP